MLACDGDILYSRGELTMYSHIRKHTCVLASGSPFFKRQAPFSTVTLLLYSLFDQRIPAICLLYIPVYSCHGRRTM